MSETERRSALLLLAILGAAALFMTALAPLALAGLAIPVALIGAWFLLSGAARRSRTTIYLIVFLSVFLLDATFRVRDYADKGIDFQVLIKIAIWLTIAAVALFHASRWLGEILTPGNLPWILFLLWLLFTATLSPIPAYSAFTAFSICAHVAFCAYLFSNFERAEIFAVMVLALTAFCLVSIAVYFAVPEFGRFVYWLNEQRYVSPRLAGIAGSANNMGRLAAFGLILIILYASAFRRLHPLLVPVCGFTLALSLVMTNSRSSMIMVIALGFSSACSAGAASRI
ncbi:MAG: hypothetical protein HC850_07295 [Rhodomicrobium sp.]|nr:hypothetical protein [Rhodomicrobium sp.]